MNYKAIVKNLAAAFAAQGISFVVSVVTSLVVPKILGVTEYGFWQLFLFYTSYVGFFHFGLNDGVYLLFGGVTRDKIDKKLINSELLFGLVYQSLIALGITAYTICFIEDEKRCFVFLFTAFFLLLYNITYFYSLLFQAMNETRLFSISSIIDRTSFFIVLVVLVGFHVDTFEVYVVGFTLAKLISLAYCVFNARDFIAAGFVKPRYAIRAALHSISVGFNLMIANIADMLILGIGRFLVDSAWGIEAFGKVSFSLSLVNFFITFVTQASMVLFPALRQGSKQEQIKFYILIRDVMELLFPAIFILYFPMVVLLSCWLPQYSESMIYFAYLLPVCVFNTKMDICCSTYFKVLRLERVLLCVNLFTVIGSLSFALAGVYLFNSLELVLLGAVASIACRSLVSEWILNDRLSVPSSKMAIEELFLTIFFLVCAVVVGGIVGCLIFLVAYCMYLCINKSRSRDFINMVSRLLNRGMEKTSL